MTSFLEEKFGLKGRVALVTGSSRGLGRAMALALARAGADVIVNGRDEANLDSVAAQIVRAGGRTVGFAGDLGDRAQVESLIERAIGWQGRLDILVNNAGIIRRSPAAEHSDADWDEVRRVNL